MNAGVVASRYAKALLKFVQETGNGDKVYAQAGVLTFRMQEIGQLRDYVENHSEIDLQKKIKLLEAALGEPLAMELTRFVGLVISRRRTEFFLRMLYSFLSLYREASNIKIGRLVTALPAEGLKEKMAGGGVDDMKNNAVDVNGVKVICGKIPGADVNTLRKIGDNMKDAFDSEVTIIASEADGKVTLVCSANKDAVAKGIKGY